jgi:hypothetical protein
MVEPFVDPTGSVILELRAADIAGKRIRGGEPAPKTKSYEGDALGPGHYKRFVVLTRLGSEQRYRRAGVRIHRLGIRCYGVDAEDAAELFGECARVLDNAGPRVSAAGTATYNTVDVSGGNAARDPDTGQPYEAGVIELIAGTEVFAGA